MKQRFKHIGEDECYIIGVAQLSHENLELFLNILKEVSKRIDSTRRGFEIVLASEDDLCNVKALIVGNNIWDDNCLYWKCYQTPLCLAEHERTISVHDFLNLLFTGDLLEPVEPEKDQVDLDIELLKDSNGNVGVDLEECNLAELYEILELHKSLGLKQDTCLSNKNELITLVTYNGTKTQFYSLDFKELSYQKALPLPRYLAALRRMVEQHG